MLIALELCLAAIVLSSAFFRPDLGNALFSRIEQRLGAVCGNQAVTVLAVILLALVIRFALLPIEPIPQPEVHDEFSYLLLSDTLAHGRLANPTHPMWVHFETFHENWHPTYASMYYPAQGLFLAFGQVVMGHPFWGVWLSSGLMCGAICWALQGWMAPGWAALGGLLAIIRLGTFSYWANSYWGGAVPALGASLVVGALPRIRKNHRVRDAVFMALGMAMLGSSRPYEGLFLCSAVVAMLAWWTLRDKPLNLSTSLTRVMLPASMVLVVAFACLGYYFWRVTGSPFTTPYQVNMRTYGLVYFPWQKIQPVAQFHHAAMRMLYRGDAVVGVYNFARSHPLELQLLKALVAWLFYFGPLLTLPWAVWILTRPRGGFWKSVRPELRVLVLVGCATWLSVMLTIYVGQPHYSAPLTVVFYASTLLVMREVHEWRWEGKPSGQFLVRGVVAVCVALFLVRAVAPALHMAPKPSWVRTWCSEDEQNLQRAGILNQLENTPGQHLVIVRYGENHDYLLNEWVFNHADIDSSKVIWARDMGPQNQELLKYFQGRHVWLVEPDSKPAKLSLYAE